MFYGFIFVIRMLQGIAACTLQVAAYALGTKTFAKEVDSVAAIFEGAAGIGLTIGPALGSLGYRIGGFACPFVVMALLFLIIAPLVKTLEPAEMESITTGSDMESQYQEMAPERNLTYCDLLKSRRVVFALAGILLNLACYTFVDPILADFTDNEFGIEAGTVGFIFLGIGVGYLIFCVIFPFTTNIIPRRVVIHTMGTCSALAILFYGPSTLFGLKASPSISIVGLVFGGFFNAGVLVPIVPELIQNA